MRKITKSLWLVLAALSAMLMVVSCIKEPAVKEQEVGFDSSLTTEQSQIVKGDSMVTTQLLINEEEVDCPRPTKYSVSFTYDEEAGTLFFLGDSIQSGKPILLSSLSDLALTYQAKKLVGNKVDVTVSNDAPKKLSKELVWNILADKTYWVKSEQEGDGEIAITGYDDLDAVKPDTKLAVTAKPADGWELVSLTANEEDILEDKSFVVTENTTVRAVFTTEDPETYAVTLTKEGEGKVAISGADNLDAVVTGSKLTVTAEPADGWAVSSITANGKDITADKSFVVASNTIVKVVFKKQPPKTYAVTLTKEGDGTVDISGADNLGAVVTGSKLTITAEPADGWEVSSITANGKDITTDKSFVVTSNTIVKVVFKKQPPKTYKVTLVCSEGGEATITGADDLNRVPAGTKLTIVTKADENMVLKSVTVNGELSGFNFVVTEDTVVKVVFTDDRILPNPYPPAPAPEPFVRVSYLLVDESGNRLPIQINQYWQYVSIESYPLYNASINVEKPIFLGIEEGMGSSVLDYRSALYGFDSKPFGPFWRVSLKKPLSDYDLTSISVNEVCDKPEKRNPIPLTSSSTIHTVARAYPMLADSYGLTGFVDRARRGSYLEVKYHFKRK